MSQNKTAYTMANLKILIVEDECIVARDIQNMLKRLGYGESFVTFTGKEAIEKAIEIQPDLVMMDIKLNEDMDGIEAAEKIRSFFYIPIIYISASVDEKTLEQAKKTEPFYLISKPIKVSAIQTTINKAILVGPPLFGQKAALIAEIARK